MQKMFVAIGTTAGSSIGWWLGAHIGIMTAFIVGMIGLGVGMWGGVRMARKLES